MKTSISTISTYPPGSIGKYFLRHLDSPGLVDPWGQLSPHDATRDPFFHMAMATCHVLPAFLMRPILTQDEAMAAARTVYLKPRCDSLHRPPTDGAKAGLHPFGVLFGPTVAPDASEVDAAIAAVTWGLYPAMAECAELAAAAVRIALEGTPQSVRAVISLERTAGLSARLHAFAAMQFAPR